MRSWAACWSTSTSPCGPSATRYPGPACPIGRRTALVAWPLVSTAATTAAAAAQARLADHPRDERHPHHLEHLSRDGRTVHRRDRASTIAVSAAADRGAAVDRQVESDVGMKERKRAHHLFDCRDLGGVALQKFQTRGHVCKQVPHLERDAGRSITSPAAIASATSGGSIWITG